MDGYGGAVDAGKCVRLAGCVNYSKLAGVNESFE
jgi:hypothetical protein